MPLEKALLMTKQGIRLPSPIGPGRLSLLKGNCQNILARRTAGVRVSAPLHPFCPRSWSDGRALGGGGAERLAGRAERLL